jgi:four helix bundle protein
MARFEDLDVWRRSSRLCVDIYKGLATCKDYGFRDQITRSCLTIPSNIAEDFERGSDKDPTNSFITQKAPPVNYAPKST